MKEVAKTEKQTVASIVSKTADRQLNNSTWYGESRVTILSYELLVMCYRLLVENLKVQVESLKALVEIQKCKFKFTS